MPIFARRIADALPRVARLLSETWTRTVKAFPSACNGRDGRARRRLDFPPAADPATGRATRFSPPPVIQVTVAAPGLVDRIVELVHLHAMSVGGILIVCSLLLLVSAPGPAQRPAPPFSVGELFPDIAFPALADGSPTRLSDFRGRKVMLHVFASW